jgi:hypothetical protein
MRRAIIVTEPLNFVEFKVVIFIWSEFSRVLVFVIKEVCYVVSSFERVTTLHTSYS